jgi:hypothetical protein
VDAAPSCRYPNASRPDEPSCTALLSDLPGMLLDRSRWPRHLCGAVAAAGARRWWWQTVGLKIVSPSGIDQALPLYPIQVGSVGHGVFQGIRWPLVPAEILAATLMEEATPECREAFGERLIDPYYVAIAWAACLSVPHGALDLMGLVWRQPRGDTHEDELWPGPLACVVRGGAGTVREAQRFVTRARHWWAQASRDAYRPRTGRPLGTGTLDGFTPDAMQRRYQALRAAFRRAHRPDPLQWQFADADGLFPPHGLGVSPDTLQRRLDDFGLSWSEFVTSCH